VTLTNSPPRVPPLALLVDSDADTRQMYAECLLFSGFRVAEATTSKEALAKVQYIRPHIITTGIWLAGEDGCALIAQLKADARTSDIPIIALTGYAEAKQLQRVRRAGCNAVLTKPCLPSRLLAEIQRLLPGASPPSTDEPTSA
jgi:two-component system cell cycle response regulator DivK